MLNLLAAFGGAYFATIVIAAFVFLIIDMLRRGRVLEIDELFMYAMFWPIVVYGMLEEATKRAVAAARRGYTAAVAAVVGFYWRIRAKLPF